MRPLFLCVLWRRTSFNCNERRPFVIWRAISIQTWFELSSSVIFLVLSFFRREIYHWGKWTWHTQFCSQWRTYIIILKVGTAHWGAKKTNDRHPRVIRIGLFGNPHNSNKNLKFFFLDKRESLHYWKSKSLWGKCEQSSDSNSADATVLLKCGALDNPGFRKCQSELCGSQCRNFVHLESQLRIPPRE